MQGTKDLSYAGFESYPDDLVEFYSRLLDRYTEKMEPDNDGITRLAFEFYVELMAEKKRRNS